MKNSVPFHENSNSWLERKIDFFLEVIGNKSDGNGHARNIRILFVGCGSGLEAFYVKNKTKWDVVGLDVDINRINAFLRKNINATLGDALTLPFKDDVFDICYCSHVLEHVYAHQQVLKEIRRVLRTDGQLFLSVPNKGRLVGYVGSNEEWPLTTILKLNIQDYRARIRRKFMNWEGAHAGFNRKELLQELEKYFNKVTSITPYYLEQISRNTMYESFARLVIRCRLTQLLSPSNVFLAVKSK